MGLSYFSLWGLTQLVDYSSCIMMYFILCAIERLPLWLWSRVLFSQTLNILLVQYREEFYFTLFHDRLPLIKRQKSQIENETFKLMFQNVFFVWCLISFAHYFEPFKLIPITASQTSGFLMVYGQFIILLMLRDAFLSVVHRLMHSPKYYYLHKVHHQVNRQAQSLHAFHIDILDIFLETYIAVPSLFMFQYFLSGNLELHMGSLLLFTMHDFTLHSINPYSVSYFNPILDFALKPNICHQLHHVVQNEYFTFTPYHHFIPGAKERDYKRYNKLMKTNFAL